MVVVREANQLLEFGTCSDYRIRNGKVSALRDFDLSRLRRYVRVNINYFKVSLDSRFSYLRHVSAFAFEAYSVYLVNGNS